MKYIPTALCAVLLSGAALLAAPAAHAQINININPPSWGPAVPAGAQYYYIPETNGFYDVPARQYVVLRDGRWVRRANLTGYNTANFHPVVVDYVGAQPWVRYKEYKVKYPKHGNAYGIPPGQAKKMSKQGYIMAPANGTYYPEQHYDKHEGKGKDKDKGHGKGKH